MNRYPLWKYLVIVVALLIGAIYTLPNFFGEAPAVQISAGKATVKIEPSLQDRAQDILQSAQIAHKGVIYERMGITAPSRFASPRQMIKSAARMPYKNR